MKAHPVVATPTTTQSVAATPICISVDHIDAIERGAAGSAGAGSSGREVASRFTDKDKGDVGADQEGSFRQAARAWLPPASFVFEGCSILVIASSMFLTAALTIPRVNAHIGSDPHARTAVHAVSISIGFAFVLDYVVRLVVACCGGGMKGMLCYMFSLSGFIDAIACLTLVDDFNFADRSRRHLNWWWMLRIFRVLKVMRYLTEMNVIVRAVAAQAKAMVVFMVCVFVLCFVVGSLLFYVEDDADGFNSIPAAVWNVIISITTVGYGDMVPKTAAGRCLISCVVLLGYSTLAVPTIVGVMCIFFTQQGAKHAGDATCPDAAMSEHLRNLLVKPAATPGAHLTRMPFRPWDLDMHGKPHPSAYHQLCEAAVFDFYAAKASWKVGDARSARPTLIQSAMRVLQPVRGAFSPRGEVVIWLTAASVTESSCMYHIGLGAVEGGPVFVKGLIEHSWVRTRFGTDEEEPAEMPAEVFHAIKEMHECPEAGNVVSVQGLHA